MTDHDRSLPSHDERVAARESAEIFVLPPYGYLESVEVFPASALPNMEASSPYRLYVELRGPGGRFTIDHLVVHCRSVK